MERDEKQDQDFMTASTLIDFGGWTGAYGRFRTEGGILLDCVDSIDLFN